jgi:hypothetical protein
MLETSRLYSVTAKPRVEDIDVASLKLASHSSWHVSIRLQGCLIAGPKHCCQSGSVPVLASLLLHGLAGCNRSHHDVAHALHSLLGIVIAKTLPAFESSALASKLLANH